MPVHTSAQKHLHTLNPQCQALCQNSMSLILQDKEANLAPLKKISISTMATDSHIKVNNQLFRKDFCTTFQPNAKNKDWAVY